MKTIRERFGDRVRQLRIEHNMTQQELAEASSLSLDYISLIERGKRSPSLESIECISKALDIAVSDLFNWQEE